MSTIEQFDKSEFAKKLSVCNYQLISKENGTNLDAEKYERNLLNAVEEAFNKFEKNLTKEQKEAYQEAKKDFKYVSKTLDNKVENIIDENRVQEEKHRSL